MRNEPQRGVRVLTCWLLRAGAALAVFAWFASVTAAQAPAERALPREPQEAIGLLERTASKAWTLRVNIASQGLNALDGGQRLWLEQVAVVFPLPERAANFESRAEGMTSRLRFDGRTADESPALLEHYALGARLARWKAEDVWGTEFNLTMDVPVEAHRLRFDESRARRIGWPAGLYPPVADSALAPELFIESDSDEVVRLLRRWAGDNPRRLAPAALAKQLAARVIEGYRPSEPSYEYNSRGLLGGFNVRGARQAAVTMGGSAHDMSLLLCALYRAAGLPARVVIGFDIAASVDGLELGDRSDFEDCGVVSRDAIPPHPIIRSWVEFYLFDEARGAGEWVPVDVERQRAMSSRARPLDESWRFFGNFPCGDVLIPLAYHFVPPTTVVTPGPPALWGWVALPATPRIEHTLDVSAFTTARRAGDDR